MPTDLLKFFSWNNHNKYIWAVFWWHETLCFLKFFHSPVDPIVIKCCAESIFPKIYTHWFSFFPLGPNKTNIISSLWASPSSGRGNHPYPSLYSMKFPKQNVPSCSSYLYAVVWNLGAIPVISLWLYHTLFIFLSSSDLAGPIYNYVGLLYPCL